MHVSQSKVGVDARSMFISDASRPSVTVEHECVTDAGAYRHLRVSLGGSFDGYRLITWPGSLLIQGGHGTYVFSRIEDMFAFFRGSYLNLGYWAEKLPSGRDSIESHDRERFLATAAELINDYRDRYPDLHSVWEVEVAEWESAYRKWLDNPVVGERPREPVEPVAPQELVDQLAEADEDGLLESADECYRLLRGWQDDVVSDVYEYRFTDWDFHYAWSCCAVLYGIELYDAHREGREPRPVAEVVEDYDTRIQRRASGTAAPTVVSAPAIMGVRRVETAPPDSQLL